MPDKRITAWLDARPDVQNWRVGEEFDVWHGDFKDIDDEIEELEFKYFILISHISLCNVMCDCEGGGRYGNKFTDR
ncbi:MAG: hypothetical protein ABIE47_12770 [Pseudomonadota bacterium]